MRGSSIRLEMYERMEPGRGETRYQYNHNETQELRGPGTKRGLG